jgi:hypothetical protein
MLQISYLLSMDCTLRMPAKQLLKKLDLHWNNQQILCYHVFIETAPSKQNFPFRNDGTAAANRAEY